jgi:TBC1 domain family member 15
VSSTANNSVVNELSNTIDLDSTLLKAEALFRRFERTVEAIDRKHNFPPPRPEAPRRLSSQSPITDPRATPALLRDHRRTSSSGVISLDESVNSGNSNSAASPVNGPDTNKGKTPARQEQGANTPAKAPVTKVVSPELRALLRRDVVKMDAKEVKQHGGGMGNS